MPAGVVMIAMVKCAVRSGGWSLAACEGTGCVGQIER